MNNKELNIALGKLFNGIELDTHKVELGIVDDFKKLYANATEQQAKGNVQVREILKAIDKAINEYNDAANSYIKANNAYQDIEAKTKELGTKPSSQILNYAKDTVKSVKEINSILKNLKSIKGKL